MLVRDGITADSVLASELTSHRCLTVTRVDSGEGFEVGGERRGKALVSLCGKKEKQSGIAASEVETANGRKGKKAKRTNSIDVQGISSALRCVVQEESAHSSGL
jgi:hypothetical protein